MKAGAGRVSCPNGSIPQRLAGIEHVGHASLRHLFAGEADKDLALELQQIALLDRVDTVGTAPFSCSKGALKERGRLLLVVARLPDMLQIPWVSMTR